MSYHWPFLDSQGVSSTHELAELYIKRLLGKSFIMQLKELNIVRIQLHDNTFATPGLSEVQGAIFKDKNEQFPGWVVTILDSVDWRERMVIFGHEIGHTLLFDPKTLEPFPGCEEQEPGIKTNQHRVIEQFAEEFGFLWASYTQNRETFREFFESIYWGDSERKSIYIRPHWPPSP